MMRYVFDLALASSHPSPPSYRYAYLLWMVLALIAIIYAVAHHLRLSGGSIGAAYAKLGMRRHVLGSKKPGKRNRALPSNNVMLAVVLITAVTIVLCLIGADYVVPSSSILDFSKSFRKRASASPTSPGYTINKSFWTLGSRFGFMAFALMPAVVLFALKSPPIGFLSLRLLTQLHSDKLAMLHRGVAWLVWGITTAHVALWTVQLFEDSRNGRATWFFLWTNYRFIFGCVAYAALCGVMVLSLRPIRKNRYEVRHRCDCRLMVVFLHCACGVGHSHYRRLRCTPSRTVVLDGCGWRPVDTGEDMALDSICKDQCGLWWEADYNDTSWAEIRLPPYE